MKYPSFASVAVLPVFAALSLLVQDPFFRPTPLTQQVRPSRLGIIAEVRPDERPIEMKSVRVQTHIVGMRATTVMETVVYNPNNRVLEGTFSVPLVDGQVVVGMALDINGKMRDAVVVDKSKGRATFEAIQRRGVDPALVEWTRDNSFKTRVYPIMARQSRTVRIVLEQDLTQGSNGFQYTLPMTMTDTVRSFTWDVRVDGFGTIPSVVGDDQERIEFTGNGRHYTYKAERTNVVAQSPFVIDVPVAPSADVVTVNTWKGESVFSIAATSPNVDVSNARPAPSTVTIVWDASYSARLANREKQLAFIRELFTKWPNVAVRLDVVAHTLVSSRQYSVRNGDARNLLRDLEQTHVDGASNLAAIPCSTYTSDVVLMFTDGIQTFGPATTLACPRPTYCIVATPTADSDRLRAFASATGGALVDLTTNTTAEAVRALSTVPLVLERIRVVDGTVNNISPSTATTVDLGTTILGMLKGASATIELTYTLGGVAVEQRVVLVSAERHARDGAMAVRQWAAMRVAQLAANRRANADSIAALGLHYAIVTPRTSLIVLETLADYVRYDIEPPASEPELVAQWKSHRSTLELSKLTHGDIQRVTSMLNGVANQATPASAQARTRSAKQGEFVERTLVASEDMAYDMAAPSQAQAPVQTTPVVQPSGNGFQVRGSRASETKVFVDGLEGVTEQFTGGLGNAGASVVTFDSVSLWQEAQGVKAQQQPKHPTEPWSSELQSLNRGSVYAWYLLRRAGYERVPGFFVDVAEQLRKHGDSAAAIRVLSTLAELDGENHRVMRVLGRRLLQYGRPQEAIHVFRDVMDIRDEEPQSYRDLALALDAAGKYQEAVDMLFAMAKRAWDSRFPEIELIALNEMNRIVSLRRAQVTTAGIPKELLFDVTSDIRVVMDWDADNCDMDLMITEPDGVVCMYNNPRTPSGGKLSRDLVGGYGPEEYTMRKAKKGRFVVQAKYYGDRQQTYGAGATTVQVTVFRNYGRANETVQHHTIRIRNVRDHIDVTTFDV